MADEPYANQTPPTPERVVARFAREFASDLRVLRRPVTKVAGVMARLVGPFMLVTTFLAGVYLFAPQMWERILGLIAFYLTPFGAEAGVPVGLHMGIPPALLVTLIVLVDLQFALLFLLNGDYAKRLPRIGLWLAKTEAKARAFYAKHAIMSKAGFVGLAVFVMVPLAGTGSMSATVIGKMMGFSPFKALLAIALGSVARSLGFVFAYLGVVSAL